jgi:SAM-dependent methyltransferase
MNGLHVFPDKDKAYSEILRTLKSGGELLACFYIAGEQKVADWLANIVMTRMGWFTPPFDTANDVRRRLKPYYDILGFHVEGAMLYFRAKKSLPFHGLNHCFLSKNCHVCHEPCKTKMR